ncbi:hypothetical protein ABW20_dc0102059 [Dactylellina cionopaga]|nr:hypothetical protein ABW20_dc0102059 [Dactylellina cionopaga]
MGSANSIPQSSTRAMLRRKKTEIKEFLVNRTSYLLDPTASMASSTATQPPSPTKRTSRFFGNIAAHRHKRSESAGDLAFSPMEPPQLPPLDFSFGNAAPPSPTKTEHQFGGPLPRPNQKIRHAKSPSLMDLFTGKAKKDNKKDSGFTISTDEDYREDRIPRSARPAAGSRVLQPAFDSQIQGLSQFDPQFLSMDSDSIIGDQENPRPRKSRLDTNKALPPIKTDIPMDVAREISLYTPRVYTASGQRNFHVTPGLRAPQSRPTSVYSQGERKSSWGSIVSLSKRNSVMENPDGSPRNEAGSFLQRVASIGNSNGNKRMHPAALQMAPPSTTSINHEFNDLLSNFGLPHNIKSGASEMQAHVKATLLKSSKVMSKTPLPPPSRNGSPPDQSFMTNAAPTPAPTREKKKRPLSAFGAALFRGDPGRTRGKTLSTVGMPTTKTAEDKGRPKTTRAEKSFGAVARSSTFIPPTTPTGLGLSPAVVPVVGPLHANSPSDFVEYLAGVNSYTDVELGWLRRLKRMLRNERLVWVETFFKDNGLSLLVDLIKNIYGLEYHDVQSGPVLREVLLCLKAAYTAPMADAYFDAMHVELFTLLLDIMFDDDRKKTPHEYDTREVAMGLMFTYLQQAPLDKQILRAVSVMAILENPIPPGEQQGPAWVEAIRQPRPFTRWSGEVARLTYETGWVWYHPGNRIPLREVDSSAPFNVAHFPTPRAFKALDGGSVNSVEMNVANYAAMHLEILNAITAYLPSQAERNSFRGKMKISGMEKNIAQVLRCCGKGKHYEHLANLHAAMSDWVTAARADEWESWEYVRTGRYPKESGAPDKVKAMRKIEAMYGPQFELPDVGLQDTVVEKKRMSMRPEQTEDVFHVNENGGVVLEWDF